MNSIPDDKQQITAVVVSMRDPIAGNRLRSVLLLNGIIFQPLLLFLRERSLSLKIEQGYARAVSLYFEWINTRPRDHLSVEDQSLIIPSFAHDVISGTIHEDNDPNGLWWARPSPKVAHLIISRFQAFADWLAESYGVHNPNPKDRIAAFSENIRVFWNLSYKAKHSMMKHLYYHSNLRIEEPTLTRRFALHIPTPIVLPEINAFPTEKIRELLIDGFRIPGSRDSEPRPWKKWNVRDILFTLLLLYGGKRESEPCHLWVDDVFEDPDYPGRALVLIHEPTFGTYIYTDPITNKKVKTTRPDYLMRFCGGRRPLTQETGRRRVGWKGNLLHDRNRLAMRVFWIHPEIGSLFLELWEMYLTFVRPINERNPFAFLTKDGEPMGTAAYADTLKRAVQKIGLPYGKNHGTTPHGLRHWYGCQIEALGLDRKVAQLMFAHRNASSQDVYRQLKASEINDVIDKAIRESNSDRFSLINDIRGLQRDFR